jgi:mevalonate kinase
MNNDLLCCIGVGHPALDKVVRVTGKLGIKTKLTGAGGGGCAFSLIPNSRERLGSESSSLLVDQAIEKLKQNGYQCLPSLLGGPGLTFHTL